MPKKIRLYFVRRRFGKRSKYNQHFFGTLPIFTQPIHWKLCSSSFCDNSFVGHWDIKPEWACQEFKGGRKRMRTDSGRQGSQVRCVRETWRHIRIPNLVAANLDSTEPIGFGICILIWVDLIAWIPTKSIGNRWIYQVRLDLVKFYWITSDCNMLGSTKLCWIPLNLFAELSHWGWDTISQCWEKIRTSKVPLKTLCP